MSIPVPSDEICLRYASGVLDPALRLLVDAHLRRCPQTRERIAAFERIGGEGLAREEPAAMADGALDRALAAIEAAAPPAVAPPMEVGAVLDGLRWRWVGPGRRLAPIPLAGSRLKAYAMRIGPGRAMLEHGHEGEEWTVILDGAYEDGHGRFAAGAFIEEDEETLHRPVADEREGCVCLIAMSAPLAAPGLTGILARWAMR